MKIYLAGSIAGGREFSKGIGAISDTLEKLGRTIMTKKNVVQASPKKLEHKSLADRKKVVKRDKRWIGKCDAFIAEVSTYSHGVGYEHSYAESLGKPVLLLRHSSLKKKKYSAFLDGSDHVKFDFSFYNDGNILSILNKFFTSHFPDNMGKFIVVYGANNLGKSMQVKLLVKNLRQSGKKVKLIKYPIYNLKPTGPKINNALRKGLKISDLELQKTFAQNRRDYEPELIRILHRGTWVVAEDYKGTGIAWGVVNNIVLSKMEDINNNLHTEDLALLIDGRRFKDGIERKHRYEAKRGWNKARKVHLMLGERYGWRKVNANQNIEDVAKDIWLVVSEELYNL